MSTAWKGSLAPLQRSRRSVSSACCGPGCGFRGHPLGAFRELLQAMAFAQLVDHPPGERVVGAKSRDDFSSAWRLTRVASPRTGPMGLSSASSSSAYPRSASIVRTSGCPICAGQRVGLPQISHRGSQSRRVPGRPRDLQLRDGEVVQNGQEVRVAGSVLVTQVRLRRPEKVEGAARNAEITLVEGNVQGGRGIVRGQLFRATPSAEARPGHARRDRRGT